MPKKISAGSATDLIVPSKGLILPSTELILPEDDFYVKPETKGITTIQEGLRASILDPRTGSWYDIEIVEYDEGDPYAYVREVYAERTNKPFRCKVSVMQPPKNPDINTRFRFYQEQVEACVSGSLAALMVLGKGGIGKSYTTEQVMKSYELVEDEDYTVISGSCTGAALFDTLAEDPEGIFVFDDLDDVLLDPKAGSILKATLDSFKAKRKVSWLTKHSRLTFEFKGSVIFISNLDIERIDQTLKSRCVTVNLSMTDEEKIERMRAIAPTLDVKVPMHYRMEVLDMLDRYKNTIEDLNIRTMLKALQVLERVRDMDFVRYQILNG